MAGISNYDDDISILKRKEWILNFLNSLVKSYVWRVIILNSKLNNIGQIKFEKKA